MAQRADGTVYINTLMDTTGMKPGGKEIEAACKRMAKSVADMGNKVKAHTQEVAENLLQQNRIFAEQEQKVKRLRQQIEELREQKVTTAEFQKLEKQIVKDSEDMDRLIALQKEFVEIGGSKDDSYYTNLEARIEKLGNTIEGIKRKKEELLQSGEAYTGETVNTADTEEYRNAVKEYETELANLNKLGMGVQASFSRLVQEVQQFGGTVSGVYRLKGALEELRNIGNMVIHPIQAVKDAFFSLIYKIKDSAAGLCASVINGLLHPFQTLKSVAIPALSKLGSLATSAAKFISSKLVTSLKKAASAALGVEKHTNGAGHSFKQMLKYSLGIGSLYTIFYRVRSAIKDGFKNLAQYSTETNKSISALKSSATQLKNSLATAFAPILAVIAPILTKFINLLSQAITYIGMFFAALTGAKSFTKAVAVQEDYAESLGETAKNAKEAKRYLSGLDEIRTYPGDDSSGGGGGGGVDPSQMFAEVEIPSFVNDWIEKFKQAWESADFTEIGTIVGTKIRNALGNIPWEPIKATCNRIAQSLATFINGFVATPGLWETVGVSIGEGINTAVGMWNTFFDVINFIAIGGAIATALNNAFQTIDATELGRALSQKIRALIEAAYGFVTEFDWSGFGTWLGEVVNGFFDNIDFALAAQTLGQGIIGALNGITAFIQEVDWYGLGQKVKEFLVNIDWGGICSAMFEAIGAALAGLALFLWGLIEDAWNSVVDWWHDVAFEDGKFTIQGLLDGIVEVVKNIGSWIKEHIFEPFIEGFRSVFGIHSPSTVMAEMGTFLIQGLLNGIDRLISSVKEKFEKIKTIITNVFNSIKTSISNIWNNGIVPVIKNSINSIIGFINQMISGVVAGINTIGSALNALHIDIPDWIPGVGGKSLGFNIPTINAPQIPYLATGAVIPPNAPFMAVLGDQRNGNNLELPENLLRQIVREEAGGQRGGGQYRFTAQINRRTLFDEMIEEARLRQMMNGRNPFEMV